MSPSAPNDAQPRLWIESGEHRVTPVATVAPLAPIDKHYTYRIPDRLNGRIAPGQRVLVPFGKTGRETVAFCVELDTRPWDNTLRDIIDLVDDQPYLTPDLIALGQWIARYYLCPLGRTLAALVPQSIRKQSGWRNVRYVWPVDAPGDDPPTTARLGPRQRAVLAALKAAEPPVPIDRLATEAHASPATIRSLASRNLLRIETRREAPPAPDFDVAPEEPDFTPNPRQTQAINRINTLIDDRTFRVLLLFGVSGSGKTEVYIRSMQHALSRDRQVIMLVPEIALTTQLSRRLACRFRDVAIVHSSLSDAHRSLTWTAIREGKKRVIIGTRSAVFAPCPELGLIVADEEQESSYKNLRAPRFHVRDVAIKRAQQLGIPVVLGSATPSLETWHNCQTLDHYERIDLPERANQKPLPEIIVVDMNEQPQIADNPPILSDILIRELGKSLDRREQSVILINRRGYAARLLCPDCGHAVRCPNCNAFMVLHAKVRKILCHHCAQRVDVPQSCPDPSCRSTLVVAGLGTERVVEQIARRFPNARIARADSDELKRQDRYERLIARFAAHEFDCLVGTQMIAKGLDFPMVSLVGVLAADSTLAARDFRMGERLFQLINQVAGRAGRAETAGTVVVQTLTPDAPAFRLAVRGDYPAFARDELQLRRETSMPPLARLARILLSDPDPARLRAESARLADRCRRQAGERHLPDAVVIGPAPAAWARLRNRYRYDVLLRCPTGRDLHHWLDTLRHRGDLRAKVASVVADVDPVSLA